VLAGPIGWQYDDALAQIKRFGGSRSQNGKQKILHLDYLPFEHIVALIRGARALLFPSLYEGFGLPVLEAMSLGTPVMTSKTASLAEVAGDAALFVDPLDIQAITATIRTLDADGDLHAELAKRGVERAAFFSPEAYKRRIGALYRSIIGEIPRTERATENRGNAVPATLLAKTRISVDKTRRAVSKFDG
jgi:glycosyltransferase involved in cell wall biosynthesis